MTEGPNYESIDELEPLVHWDDNVVPLRPDPADCIKHLQAAKQKVTECKRLVEIDERLLAESHAALLAAKNELGLATRKLLFSLGVE